MYKFIDFILNENCHIVIKKIPEQDPGIYILRAVMPKVYLLNFVGNNGLIH